MPIFADPMGNRHDFATAPRRIVSLVPSQTELLYELGLEEQIVGITKFCVHPFHFKSVKTIVGGTKKVNFDKIRELQPDIIICNKEENTQEMVAELELIAPVWVTNVITLEDNLEMIASFGAIFGRRTEAQKWTDKIAFAHRDFLEFIQSQPVRKVAYLIWKNPYMAAGEDNFINELLKLNRFENIYTGNPKTPGRYPEVEIRKMRIQGDPEIVFLSSEPYPFKDDDAFEIGKCTHHAKMVFVDGEMFSWYGTRILKAFAYFKKIHERIA